MTRRALVVALLCYALLIPPLAQPQVTMGGMTVGSTSVATGVSGDTPWFSTSWDDGVLATGFTDTNTTGLSVVTSFGSCGAPPNGATHAVRLTSDPSGTSISQKLNRALMKTFSDGTQGYKTIWISTWRCFDSGIFPQTNMGLHIMRFRGCPSTSNCAPSGTFMQMDTSVQAGSVCVPQLLWLHGTSDDGQDQSATYSGANCGTCSASKNGTSPTCASLSLPSNALDLSSAGNQNRWIQFIFGITLNDPGSSNGVNTAIIDGTTYTMTGLNMRGTSVYTIFSASCIENIGGSGAGNWPTAKYMYVTGCKMGPTQVSVT